ncbi:MAG: hypothetical protein Q8S18_10985 [Bacteroidales bacterium]|nr:hypothetical protein [Bacteroidales bacterium]
MIALSLLYSVNGQGVYNIIKQINETGSGPEKSAMTQNINNPINLGTGGVNFELPLFEITQNDYKLPVSLNYVSNGFKVSEISSNVGLGWQISAGGMITRTIKGLRDEINYNGYLSEAGSTVHQELSDGEIPSIDEDQEGFLDAFQALMYTVEGLYDSEPDIYTFSFGNNTGSFLFDHEGNIQFIPEQNFQINVIRIGNSNTGESNHILSFELTDADGIVYVFGHTEDNQYREETLIESFAFYSGLESYYISPAEGFYPRKYRTSTTTDLNNDNHYSAWLLQKIILTDKSEISFEYVLDEIFTYVGTDEVYYAWYSLSPLQNNGNYGPFLIDDPYVVSRYNKFRFASIPRLSRINWDLGKIVFVASDSQREDMNDFQSNYEFGDKKGYAINNVIIEDYLGLEVSTIELDQSYFEYPGGSEFEYYPSYFKRLRLDEVRIQDKSYTFEYYYGELSDLGGLFFPSRNTSQVDLWGYYKKYTGIGTAPRVVKPSLYCYPDDVQNPLYQSIYSVFPRSSFQGIEYYFDGNLGNNLDPNPEFAKVGMIKGIHLPTGGSIEYEYELNDFIFDGNQFTGGGIRVSKINKKHDANGDFTTIQYKYETSPGLSSGRLTNFPQHAKSNYYSEKEGWDTYFSGKDKYSIRTTRQFSTMADMNGTNESIVRYGKVTEYINGKGRTEYFFNMPFMAEDYELFVDDQLFISKSDILRTTYYQAPEYPNVPPYLLGLNHRDGAAHLTDPLTGWFCGKLEKEIHFDDQARKILEKTYHYSIKPSSDPGVFYLQSKYHANVVSLWAVLDENQGPDGEFEMFELDIIWGINRYKTGSFLLDKIETAEYDPNSNNYLSKNIEYEFYDLIQHYGYISEEKVVNSDQSVQTTNYIYPFNYPDGYSYIMDQMKTLNMLNQPNEIIKSRNNVLVEADLTKFNHFSQIIKPHKAYKLEISEPLSDFTPSNQLANGQIDPRYQMQTELNYSPVFGNLLEVKPAQNIDMAYIWGYNNSLLIAKIENASYDLVTNELSSLGHSIESLQNKTDSQLRQIFNDLRNRPAMQNAMITSFTHKPLVGITSQTDPTKLVTYYEYDNFGRLKYVKNNEGEYLNKYDYHYKE